MKYSVEYKGGQSRYGADAVDYMLVVVDDVELYAEEAPDENDEAATYDGLKDEILAQAAKSGIPADSLQFFYDE